MNKHPLTPEQQQLITEYLSDGYKRAKQCIRVVMRKKLTEQELDEYIGVVHEALVKAAQRFRKNKGMKFSSFANMTIQSGLKTYLTYTHRDKRIINKMAESLDASIDDNGTCIKDLLVGTYDVEIQEFDRIDKYLSTLSENAKKVLNLKLQGYKYTEISEKLGFDKRYMRDILLSLQKYERVQILRREFRK